MSYIVMARDECNEEFRPSSKSHWDAEGAYAELEVLREQYQEARSMWVEEFRDKGWYRHRILEREQWYDHPEDIYGDY